MRSTATGFFIHRRAYSIKAKLLTFYTLEEGSLSFLHYPSKKNPALIPFSKYEIEYDAKASLNSILGLSLVDPANHWHTNPQKLAVAYFIADVVNQTTQIKHQDIPAFDVLLRVESILSKDPNNFFIPLQFLNLWMEVLGILPEPLQQANAFDVSEGVFLSKTQGFDVGAITWNELLQNKCVEDKNALKQCFSLMISYCSMHAPNFNATSTLEILKQMFS